MSATLLPARVQAMRHEAPDILTLELRPCSRDAAFPAHDAGAHVDLHLPNGLVRSYSLVNPGADAGRYVVGVLNDRNSRGGSRYVHEQLRVGTVLQISAPRNNFSLDESAPSSVFVAGGIGITPILCMLQRLMALGREAELIFCTRSREDAPFMEAIEAMQAQGLRVHHHADDEAGGPPQLARLLAGYASDTHFYACGPAPMLDAFQAACAAHGHAHVHVERFAALAPPAVQPKDEQGFDVELRRSGKTVTVAPGVSVLDALLGAGVPMDHSCREGICGACETRVLAGEVDHRDSILTAQERCANRSMMVCVSGCRTGPLVLDV